VTITEHFILDDLFLLKFKNKLFNIILESRGFHF